MDQIGVDTVGRVGAPSYERQSDQFEPATPTGEAFTAELKANA
ncbi:hypothetical protein [Salipiger bermudensis]